MSKEWTRDIEFSFEDAGRSDIGFMKEMCDVVIESGAKTINIPDTVGILMPSEIGSIISQIVKHVGERAIISTHNHNDLGMATANSIEAIKNGARQIECAINGIGERAGNTALEEVVMILKTKENLYGEFKTGINSKEIYKTSQMVAGLTGMIPQANKAIIGENAFAHESGIHQDGMLKNKSTYQIIDPEDIGYNNKNTIVLGKHSGRAAIKDKIDGFGFNLCDDEITNIFNDFKALCDRKKEIFEEDLHSIVRDRIHKKSTKENKVELLDIKSGETVLKLKLEGEIVELSEKGNGTIDAIFKTVDKAIGINHTLVEYKVNSVGQKKDALAEVHVKIEVEGIKYEGRGLDIDTIKASVIAYIDAINKIK